MRLVMNVCSFFVGIALLSLILGTLNEVFNLGIWNNDYPVLGTDEETDSVTTVPGSYGEFVVLFGIVMVVSGVIGTLLYVNLDEE